MLKTLQPLVAKDQYAALIEQHLIEYFRDAIFGPLLDLMHDYGVQTKTTDQAIGKTPDLKNGESDWTLFPADLRSLRMKRAEMPQIASDERLALAAYLARRGIPMDEGTIAPGELRPSQEGYWPERLELAREYEGTDRAILISQDWFIVDGHHQWYAALLDRPEQKLQVTRYRLPIHTLLNALRSFSGTRFKNAGPSEDAVAAALRSGKIRWAAGEFTGEFNALISRQLRQIGATFDPKTRSFSLPLAEVPIDLRQAVAESEERAAALHKQTGSLLRTMEQTIPTAPTGLDLRKAIDRISADLQKQFERTVPAAEKISVQAKITPEMRAAITSSLTENLDLYIKQFASEQIPELRRLVEENALQGGRADVLARIIEARFGVSKRKAAFLARQETSLIVSKYREERYKRLGSREYKWSTSHDERVRPDHARLNGKVFSWDSPPITDSRTGAHNNPGEDFNCRCVALPIIDYASLIAAP